MYSVVWKNTCKKIRPGLEECVPLVMFRKEKSTKSLKGNIATGCGERVKDLKCLCCV